MSSTNRRKPWGAVVVAAVAAGVGWTFAQGVAQPQAAPAANLLPAKSILYYSTDGDALHEAAWQQTAAYEAFVASGLSKIADNFVAALSEQAEANGAGPQVELALSALKHLQNHGLSLAITVEPPQNGPPTGYAILVLHQAAEFAEPLSQIIVGASQGELDFAPREVEGRTVTSAVIPGSPGVEVGWWTEGTHLVLVTGIDAVNGAVAVAAGKSPNVTANPLWAKYMAPKRTFEVTSGGWLDVKAIRELTSGIPIPVETSDPNQPLTVGAIIELAGLQNLNAVVGQAGYKGKALWGETWVEAPAPRTGLLGLSDGEPLSLDSLPPLPYGLTTFTAARLDGAAIYDELLKIIRGIARFAPDPDAEVQINGFIEQARDRLGMDVRDDLLSAVGGVFCGWNDSQQGILSMGAGFAIQLRDADKFSAGIDKLLAALQGVSDGEIRVRRVDKHGRELVMIEFGPTPFGQTFCVAGDWLVLGSPQVVEAFLLRVDGRLPRWQPNAEYQAALAEVPGKFSSVTVSSPRGTVNLVMGLAPMAIGFLRLGLNAMQETGEFPAGFDIPLNVEDIPPAELISAPLFPNVLVSEVNDEGFHYVSRSSFPAIPLVGSDAGTTTAVVAVGVALLLPAVQQVREAARRTQSQNNLRQLALAVHNYEAANRELPRGTIANDDLGPEERLSWLVSILPYIEQAALFEQIDRKQGWKVERNALPLQSRIESFLNPGVGDDLPVPEGDFDDSAYGRTHYVGIGGLGKDGPLLKVDDAKAGMFGYDRATRMRDVTDGLSNTIMISEATFEYGPWGAGGRATVRPFVEQPYINGPDNIGGPWGEGANMAFADGSTRFISRNIDPSVLEALTTISGGEVVQAP